MLNKNTLAFRAVRRGLTAITLEAALLFLPAGTLRFWQAWSILAVECGGLAWSYFYFSRRAPEVVERRLLKKEKQREQKIVMIIWRILGAASTIVAALDHRFGWSVSLFRPVPLWLEVAAFLAVLGGYILYFEVLKANRFAASVIQTETGQTVVSSGPYRFMRHPMYFSFLIVNLAAPLALGSFVAFPLSMLVIPLIIFRLVNEEKLLRRDLAGYAAYCQRTRRRLIPLAW